MIHDHARTCKAQRETARASRLTVSDASFAHDGTYEAVPDYVYSDSMPANIAADTSVEFHYPDVMEDGMESDAAVKPPEPDALEEEVFEADDVCLLNTTEPQVLYLSADDSSSQASPVIARRLSD